MPAVAAETRVSLCVCSSVYFILEPVSEQWGEHEFVLMCFYVWWCWDLIYVQFHGHWLFYPFLLYCDKTWEIRWCLWCVTPCCKVSWVQYSGVFVVAEKTQTSHPAVLKSTQAGWRLRHNLVRNYVLVPPLCVCVYFCSDLRDRLDGWVRKTYESRGWQVQIFFDNFNLKRRMEAISVAD